MKVETLFEITGKGRCELHFPSTVRMPAWLHQSLSALDFPVWNDCFFCSKCGEVWAKRLYYTDGVKFEGPNLKWACEYIRCGGPLFIPRQVDFYLEHRTSLTRQQQEFLLNDYSSHRDYYTSNAYVGTSQPAPNAYVSAGFASAASAAGVGIGAKG